MNAQDQLTFEYVAFGDNRVENVEALRKGIREEECVYAGEMGDRLYLIEEQVRLAVPKPLRLNMHWGAVEIYAHGGVNAFVIENGCRRSCGFVRVRTVEVEHA